MLIRVSIVLTLAGLAALLAGCDTPDMRHVVFKPAQEDPEAYKNALRAYLLTQEERAQPWGNAFLLRPSLDLFPGRAPLPDHPVRIDGLEVHASRKGFLELDRLRPGFHSLEVGLGERTHRFALPVEKGRMTLAVLEETAAGALIVSHTVREHGYLLTVPFRELAEFHRALREFVAAFERRAEAGRFADLLGPEYADALGGRGDLLKALGFLERNGRLPQLRVLQAVALVNPGHADAVLEVLAGGKPAVARFTLESRPEPGAPWRLTAVAGINPLVARRR